MSVRPFWPVAICGGISNQARYEVPKGGGRHSMFAGALWLGGVDEGNQLKLAAMTYQKPR